MTAAATLFGASNPTKESISTNKSNSQTQEYTARSIDRAKIVIDHPNNSMTSIELFKEDDSDDASSSSDSDNEESSKDGFSDTDGASTSSDEDDENFGMTRDDDSDISSTISDNNGYLQINVDGGTLHILDGTITSPTTTNNTCTNAKPTPARPRSGAIVDPNTPSPSKTSKSAGHTPDASLTPMTVSSTPSTSPPPPPPPSSNNAVQDGDKGPTLEESSHQQQDRSPAPGPFQYPPGIPRHKRDRVLRPSPLPSPAKSARRALWKRSGTGSPSNDRVGPPDASSSASSKKASSAAATILAANMTPGTPKQWKRQVHASGTSSAANANTPHRSDSSGENGSSMLMTEEGRRKREEIQLARLVDMAKRQQRFAAAWFATSQGQDAPDVVPPPPPSRHRASRVGSLAPPEGGLVRSTSKSELNFATGPIDADSGEAWEGPGGAPRESSGRKSSPSFHLHSASHQSLELEPIQSGNKDNGGDAASYVSTSSSKTPKTSNASPDKRGRGRSTSVGGDIERGMTASPSPEGRSDLFIDLSNDESESSKRGNGDSFWTREIRIGPCRLGAMNCFVMAVLAVVVAGAAIVGFVSTPGNNGSGPDSVVTDVPSNSIPGSDIDNGAGPRDDIVPIFPGDKSTIPGDDWRDDVDIFLRTSEPTGAMTTKPTGVLSIIATTSNPTSTPTYRPSPAPSLSHLPSQAPSVVPTSLYQATSFTQIDKTLSGKEPGFQFGYSVALSSDGSVMAVGSRYADDNGPRSGEVRVFVLSPKNKWEQLGKTIKGRNEADQFGFSVALSSDGLTLAASEPGFDGEAGDRSGNVRIFQYDSGEPKVYGTNGSWMKTGDLSGEDSTALFGVSISLSGDGSRLAVGAPYHDSDKLDEMGESLRKAGRVRVFEYTNEWKPLGQPIDGKSPSSWWGWSVDLSVDGDFFAAGAIHHVSGGYVQVYRLENDAGSIGDADWAQLGNDIYSQDALADDNEGRLDDRFGHSVSLSGDADRIIVGSPNSDVNGKPNSGMAIVYEQTIIDGKDTVWTAIGKPIVGKSNNAEAGWSVAISGNSSQIIVGAPGDSTVKDGAGSATSLRWNDDMLDWEPARPLYGEEKDGGYGFSVAISADGNIIGIGAPSGDDDQGFVGAYAY